VPGGQHDQDAGIIAPGRDDQRTGARNLDVHQHIVARGIAIDHRAAELLRQRQGIIRRIDHDNLLRVGPPRKQLLHRLAAARAKAGDHDMVVQIALNKFHAPIVPGSFENKIIGRTDKD